MLYLRSREGVYGDGVGSFDLSEQILVPGEREPRVKPALYHDLGATGLHGFAHLFENGIVVEEIRLRVSVSPEKCAEPAFVLADVRVVDVSVYDECHRVAESLTPHGVGLLSQCDEVAVEEELYPLGLSQAAHGISSLSPDGSGIA